MTAEEKLNKPSISRTIYGWAALVVLIFGLYGGGIAVWNSLCADVAEGKKMDMRLAEQINKVDIKHTEKLSEIISLGTNVSRNNTNTLMKQEEALNWIKLNLSQMNNKLDKILMARRN